MRPLNNFKKLCFLQCLFHRLSHGLVGSTEQARSARAGDEREAPEGMMGTSTFLDKSIRELSKDTRQPEMKSFLI